jgi:SEC-C motif domain protein
MRSERCPCSSGLPYSECCGPLHAGAAAPTAETLMRSRYSAFALLDTEYLLQTWHASTRPRSLELDASIRWIGLRILGRTRGGPLDHEGTVEFDAAYRGGSQHDNSAFIREGGRWFYLGEATSNEI